MARDLESPGIADVDVAPDENDRLTRRDIKIAPRMINAGASVLEASGVPFAGDVLAREVYIAMRLAEG